jgi:Tfp pilus assembly protein PilO
MLLLQMHDGPSIGQLVVIMLGTVPILGILGWTAVKIFGPLGQAVSKRIAGGSDGEYLEQRLESIVAELEQVKHQLAETQERLDFTERLLAQDRNPEQLRRGPST